jgi:hypothetical protein
MRGTLPMVPVAAEAMPGKIAATASVTPVGEEP